MYGRAGPLLTSTMMLLWPMSIDLKFKPERAFCRSLLNSGSRGCWLAMACQSIPRSPIALTTHWRSCRVASRTAGGAVEASSVLEVGFASTRELEAAGGSGCGSGRAVDDEFEGVFEATELISGISSFGRESASATTFALPLR